MKVFEDVVELRKYEYDELRDEIERLRAALREIANYQGLRPGATLWATDIARRALEEK